MKKILSLIGVLVIIAMSAMALSSCTQTSKQLATAPFPSSEAGGNTYNVQISNFAFNPGTITIAKGATVIWTNGDAVQHTVSSDSGGELSSGQLGQTETYSHTFTGAGTYTYHCSIHPHMTGKVVVNP